MRLDTLLGDCLCNTLAVTSFELTSKQVAEPALEERNDAAHEEQPYTPSWCPETTSRTLAYRPRVEAVIDKMLQVLCHAHLPHQLVLVPVHTGQGSDVSKDVLQCVGKLEGINVPQTVLNVCIDNKLSQAKNFTAQMESISEPRLLTLLRGQRPEERTVRTR